MPKSLEITLPAAALLAIVCLSGRSALAQDAPVPPCAGPAVPSAGAAGESLNQLVLFDDEAASDWIPPACTGWVAGPTKVLLAAAGRFELAGDSAALASRLTQFSSLTEIVYWSSTRNRWRRLFEAAVALSEPNRESERIDFTAEDFVPDAELYYWSEEDNPTAGVVHQMIVHERTPDRLVFETVNRTSIRTRFLIFRGEIAPPGELRQLYYVDRESDDSWHFYSLVRLGRASGLAGTSEKNYRNRTEAFFRFIANLPMDREPPAAR